MHSSVEVLLLSYYCVCRFFAATIPCRVTQESRPRRDDRQNSHRKRRQGAPQGRCQHDRAALRLHLRELHGRRVSSPKVAVRLKSMLISYAWLFA